MFIFSSDIPQTMEEKLDSDFGFYNEEQRKEQMQSFWMEYKSLFGSKQERLWDTLLLGLQKYHEILRGINQKVLFR